MNDMRRLIDILWGDPRGGGGRLGYGIEVSWQLRYGPSYRKGKGVYMFGREAKAYNMYIRL